MILIQNTVKQITFGDSSSYQNGLLTVSKEELSAAALKIPMGNMPLISTYVTPAKRRASFISPMLLSLPISRMRPLSPAGQKAKTSAGRAKPFSLKISACCKRLPTPVFRKA